MPVNDGDPRLLNIVSNSDFATVIANQTTPKNYVFKESITISSNVVVPAHLTFEPQEGATFVKSGSGTLTFEGVGLAKPLAKKPAFSGFGAGQVKFTGADYPRHISARLFDAASLSKSLQIALDAFKHPTDWTQNKPVTIRCHAGNLDSVVLLRRFASLEVMPSTRISNTFTPISVYDINRMGAILLEGDNHIYGYGPTSIIHGSNTIGNSITNGQPYQTMPVLIEPASQFSEANSYFTLSTQYGSGGAYPTRIKNVVIENLHFQGAHTYGDSQATPGISLGACENGHIRFCSADNWDGYSFNIGRTGPSAQDVAQNCSISDCVITRSGYHAIAIINGIDCMIKDNFVSKMSAIKYEIASVTATPGNTTLTVPAIANYQLLQADWCALTHISASGVQTIWRINCSVTNSTTITLGAPIPSQISSATGTVKFEIIGKLVHCLDIEPNTGSVFHDRADEIKIVGNIFDATESKAQSVFGIIIQGTGTRTGCRNITVKDNDIIGEHPTDLLSSEKKTVWLNYNGTEERAGVKDLVLGIRVWDAESCEISDNTIQACMNSSLALEQCYNLTVKNNIIINHYPGAAARACAFQFVTNSVFEGNRIFGWQGHTFTKAAWENLSMSDTPAALIEATRVSVSGAVATWMSGMIFRWWWAGRTVTINGSPYTVQSVTHTGEMTLTTSPNLGNNNGTGFPLYINLSGNEYRNNEWTLSKASDSTSKVVNFKTDDEVKDLAADIFSAQHNGATVSYNPTTRKATISVQGLSTTILTDVFKYNYNGGASTVTGWSNVGSGTLVEFGASGTDYDTTTALDKSGIADQSKLPPDTVLRSQSFYYGMRSSDLTIGNLAAGKEYTLRLFGWNNPTVRGNGQPNFMIGVNGGPQTSITPGNNKVWMAEFTFTAVGGGADVLNFDDTDLGGGGHIAAAHLIRKDVLEMPIFATNPQAGNYTLTASDNGKQILCTGTSGTQTITVPAGLGANFYCEIAREGVADVIFAVTGGAQLKEKSGRFKLDVRYSRVFLRSASVTNQHIVSGDLVAGGSGI